MSVAQLAVIETPRDPLAGLKQRRADLKASISNFSIVRNRLHEAETAENAALAAIGELGASEIAAMTQWASAGAVGDPPQVDMQRRQELLSQLALCQVEAAAAQGAGRDVESRIGAAQAELVEIERQMHEAAEAAIAKAYQDELAAICEEAEPFRLRIAKVYAGREFLLDRARQLQSRNPSDPAAMRLFRLANDLVGLLGPDLAVTIKETNDSIPSWATRFAELLA